MSPVNCWPSGNQLIFPTRASDVLPSVPLLSHSLEPAAACGRQEEVPCSVSTVHPLSSLWKQLSVTSSQRKGILSRKTAKDGVTQLSHLRLLLLCLCPVMLPVSHSQERKQPIRIFHQELLRESNENGRRWFAIKNFSCQWWWNDQTTRSSVTYKDQKKYEEISLKTEPQKKNNNGRVRKDGVKLFWSLLEDWNVRQKDQESLSILSSLIPGDPRSCEGALCPNKFPLKL